MTAPRLILGSASPRRLELLRQIGLTPDQVRAADIDETPIRDEKPADYARRMSLEKAAALPPAVDEVILCADTVVSAGRRILGKPQDADEARRFLRLLSGRRHRVTTAVCVRSAAGQWQRNVVSVVRMDHLTPERIAAYIASQEWQGKAGGYAIQGLGAALVPWIQGSFSAVVGLPLAETAAMLRHAGIHPKGA